MSDLRQQLLAAKKDIESKSGLQFSRESIALADLISAFVALKVADQAPAVVEAPRPALTQTVAKPSDDFLYGAS